MTEIDDILKRHETWNEQAHLMWMPDWEKCHADRATLLARVGELEKEVEAWEDRNQYPDA